MAIDSSIELRSKKKLIEDFVEKVNVETEVKEDWQKHIKTSKEEYIDNLERKENIKKDEKNYLIKLSEMDRLKQLELELIRYCLRYLCLMLKIIYQMKQMIITKLLDLF